MKNYSLIKKKKIEKILKLNIANIILKNIKDNRINLITNIVDVVISNDFLIAKIYVVFINVYKSNYIKKLIKILQNSTKYIYFILNKNKILSKIPYLIFKYDNFYLKQSNLLKKLINLNK